MQRSEPLGYRLKRLCALPVKLQILDLSHLGYTRGLGRADRERRKRKGDSLLIFSHTKPPHVHPTSTARPPKMAKKNEKGKEVAKEATAVAASAPSLARAVTEEVTKRPQSSERGRNGFLPSNGYTPIETKMIQGKKVER